MGVSSSAQHVTAGFKFGDAIISEKTKHDWSQDHKLLRIGPSRECHRALGECHLDPSLNFFTLQEIKPQMSSEKLQNPSVESARDQHKF